MLPRRVEPGPALRALPRRGWRCGVAVAIASLAAGGPSASAQFSLELPPDVRGMELVERLGEPVPTDIEMYNHRGVAVRFGELLRPGVPVILVLGYYDCPVVCTEVLRRVQQCVNGLDFRGGEQYRVIVASFDHTNTTAMAAEKHAGFTAGLVNAGPDAAEFLTLSAREAWRLCDAVGFPFKFIPDANEFAHPAAIFVLTPEGRIARYVYGVEYAPLQMKLALLEASEGRISDSIVDRFLSWCYHYDPTKGAYTLQAMRVMQAGGMLTMLSLGGLITGLRVAEVRRRGRTRARAGEAGAPERAGGGRRDGRAPNGNPERDDA